VRYEITTRKDPSGILAELAERVDSFPTFLDRFSMATFGPRRGFVARMTDSTFRIHIRPSWKLWVTFFTPVCLGRVDHLPSGSRIALTIRPRLSGILAFAGIFTTFLALTVLMLRRGLSTVGSLDDAVLMIGVVTVVFIGIATTVIMWQRARAARQREALVALFESISSEPERVWRRSA